MTGLARSLETIGRDLRLAVRVLSRARGFTAAVVATLALGIGATTALISVVDAVLIRPLPYPHSDRVVQIGSPGRPQWFFRFGGPRDFRLVDPAMESIPALEMVGIYAAGGLNLGVDPAVRLRAAAVSPGLFGVLGIAPAFGRTFTETDVSASTHLAVLSYRVWRARFAGDPEILSRTIILNGRAYSVLGVMPPRFDFPAGSDIWIPNGGDSQLTQGVPTPRILARLRPDVNYQQAREAIAQFIQTMPSPRQAPVELLSLRDVLVGNVRPTIVAVAFGALLLLLAACANAAHLLLGHVATRSREFTVRRAVGASRGQLVQLVLCEGFVLSTAALLAAVAAARWSVDVLRSIVPQGIHGVDIIAIDGRTLVAAAAVGVLTTLAFAIGPALSAWPRHAVDALRTGALATDSVRSRRFRQLLVIGEVATAAVLLCGAAALVRLVLGLSTADIGVGHENALTFRLMLPYETYSTLGAQRAVFDEIEQELSRTTTVAAVGMSSQLPGAMDVLMGVVPLLHEQLPQPANQADRYAPLLTVTPDYFAAAGIRVLAGRAFTAADDFLAYPVTVVNEAVARALGVSAAELVGARFIVPGERGNTWSVVVGVVADVMMRGPEEPAPALVYRPHAQSGARISAPWVIVSGPAGSQPALNRIREAVARVDPALPLFSVRTFRQVRADALAERRFAMTMLSGFGIASAGLAAIGLYAVVAYMVQRRTREFGIRLALGASPATLRRGVLSRALVLGVSGAGAGALLTIVAGRVLWALIPGFGRIDTGTVALVSGVVVAMAVLAALLPARQATRVDPLAALRTD